MRSQREDLAPRRSKNEPRTARKKSADRYVAAFRTHAWDAGIAELARRFFAAVPSARQVVLVDETRGHVAVPGYEKISHTEENACAELPNYPAGRSLWYNADYAMYALQRAFPGFNYFLLSRFDLAVNLSLEPMMDYAIGNRIDLIAHGIKPSEPSWHWHNHILTVSQKPWKARLFFIVLSRKAMACLLDSRRKMARQYAAGEVSPWPFCEAFVPTALKCAGGLRFAEVGRFASIEVDVRPCLSIHDPRSGRQGSLIHPVFGGRRFVTALLSTYPVQDFFTEGSALREGLFSQVPFEDIFPLVRHVFARNRDFLGIERFKQEAVEHGWSLEAVVDLAHCAPAVSSSVARHAWSPNSEVDASNANGDVLPGDYGFHTQREFNPWWMVDLLLIREIDEVTIVNRREHPQRFQTFYIETSLDGHSWITCYEQNQPQDVSSEPSRPWRHRFAEAISARYLRIVLLGLGPLHLRRIQVFGRDLRIQQGTLPLVDPFRSRTAWPPGALTDLAFCKPALSSSTGPHSLLADRELDARGATGELLHYDFGFHTLKELDPWWMVDLLHVYTVEEIVIVNRRHFPERMRAIRIESSSDGEVWVTRLLQDAETNVSSHPESPTRHRFTPLFTARYVRLVLLGFETLHLRRVQVFGRIPVRRMQSADAAEDLAHKHKWPMGPLTNLAFMKPAKSSSTSRYSVHPDPEFDAAGANGEALYLDYAFHTREEHNPWWMVDLRSECSLEEITIVNRRDQAHRFQTFCVETSCDGTAWTPRIEQAVACEVSSNADSPWRFRFVQPFRARYLRIVNLCYGTLHLRRVQIFGRVPFRRSSSEEET